MRAVVSALGEAIRWQRAAAEEEERAALQQLERAGTRIVRLTDDEHRAFRTAVQPLWDEMRDFVPPALLTDGIDA
jgi:TRAP-type C4-dicarboxylate transport system substrate-binding protein